MASRVDSNRAVIFASNSWPQQIFLCSVFLISTCLTVHSLLILWNISHILTGMQKRRMAFRLHKSCCYAGLLFDNSICISIYIYMCVCGCMYVCQYVCMHACMYVCIQYTSGTCASVFSLAFFKAFLAPLPAACKRVMRWLRNSLDLSIICRVSVQQVSQTFPAVAGTFTSSAILAASFEDFFTSFACSQACVLTLHASQTTTFSV